MRWCWDEEYGQVSIRKYGQRVELTKAELLEIISGLPGVAKGEENGGPPAITSSPTTIEEELDHIEKNLKGI